MWKAMQRTRMSEGLGSIEPELLAQSYARCRVMDVPEDLAIIKDALGEGELKNCLQQHTKLITYARLVISECLYDLSDSHDLFLLTNAEGRILELWSHPDILTAANNVGLRPGASLAEGSAGTNAVGMALALQSTVSLNGSQHLCHIFRDWSCAAAPIISKDGDLLGCIDISAAAGPIREKMALARSIARELGRLVGNTHTPIRLGVTPRQRQVLALFALGSSYKEIARDLSISIKTVEEHLDAIRNKMGTKSRRACIKKAIDQGLL